MKKLFLPLTMFLIALNTFATPGNFSTAAFNSTFQVNNKPTVDLPHVFSTDPHKLAANKSKVFRKEASVMPAYNHLISEVDRNLSFGPVSVMDKTSLPPSGSKHDYMSLAPYFWPDSSKKDGLPYTRKDGQTNPETREFKDKEYLPSLCDVVYADALAWYFSGNRNYAAHASKLLRAWFLDTATRMNPNLDFGQAVKGVTNGRGEGLIETRHFIKLIDGIGLLKGSGEWSSNDLTGMKQWFGQFLQWMQSSKVGLEEKKALNNHGVWYDAQRLSIALFLDSSQLANRIIESAADRLDKQMNDAGQLPKELERTNSFHYTVFALNPFFIIGRLASTLNVDFFHLQTQSGKSLEKGFDNVYPYLSKEKTWEGQQIGHYDDEESYLMLMEASSEFNCRSCLETTRELAGSKAAELREWLMY